MSRLVLVCDGDIYQDNAIPQCSTGWQTQIAAVPFDIGQIDPQVATAAFSAGFILFIIPWAAAWGAKQILIFLR